MNLYEGPLIPCDLIRDCMRTGVHHTLLMNLMKTMKKYKLERQIISSTAPITTPKSKSTKRFLSLNGRRIESYLIRLFNDKFFRQMYNAGFMTVSIK